MHPLKTLTLSGYKSIRSLENLELRSLNVLIGANGAGKSNFISFFKLLHELIEGRLQLHVAQRGGPDSLLHYGRRETPQFEARLVFGLNGYTFQLLPTVDNRLVFGSEVFSYDGSPRALTRPLGTGHAESLAPGQLQAGSANQRLAFFIVPAIQSWRAYHFHDTSDAANVKRIGAINDNLYLRSDAGNLAAFLYHLKAESPAEYERIRDCVRLVMPSFDDFLLRPQPLDPNSIALEWREQGSDYPFMAHHLSDGTLRFICLATLLLQPSLPSTVLIDEPELGLHPYAIQILASLLRSTSTRAQLIIATQSVPLIDQLELEDLIVVERSAGASTFKRLQRAEFEHWLEDYSLGDMWTKNIFGGASHAMTRLNIIVEGATEETFVRDLLAPHLGQHQVFATARGAETGRRGGHIFRGGMVSYTKARKDIESWLKQDSGALVSTMFDYYALPKDFPERAAPQGSIPIHQWVSRLEQALSEDIRNPRFVPYIQLHEFEALLFSDVEKTGSALGATPQQVDQLRHIRAAFETPEHINDSPETAPSKRLLQLFPSYDKPAFGSLALGRIGLAAIRQSCPHFAAWLARLESLASRS